jgi:hypothetical protein
MKIKNILHAGNGYHEINKLRIIHMPIPNMKKYLIINTTQSETPVCYG